MKRLSLKILGIFIIGVIILQSTVRIAYAENETDKWKQQQNESDKKIEEAKEHLDEIKEEKSETLKQVETLTTQIAQYQEQINDLDSQIGDLESKISVAQSQLEKAQEDYTRQEELLEARLVTIYEAGETSYLDFLLSSENIADLISNYYLVTEIATTDTELLEKIQKQKEEIENAKKTLEASKSELATSKASKQKVATQLKDSKAEKDKYASQLNEEEKKTQAEIEQLQADNERIKKELAAAEERYRKQLEELKNKPDSSNGGTASGGNYNSGGSGFLQKPVKTGSITATMYYSSGKYHGALDYGISVGTTVYAAADGVVYAASYAPGSYGYYIVIQHVNGLRTWYAHGNGTFYVSQGQTVSKGQPIMQSGNSGNSFGPHLHFEVRVSPYSWYYGGNDSRRDPRNYM